MVANRTLDDVAVKAPLERVMDILGLSGADRSRLREGAVASRQSLIKVMATLGLANDRDVAIAVGQVANIEVGEKEDIPDTAILKEELAVGFLRTHAMIPLQADDDEVVVGVIDPFDETMLKALGFACHPRAVRLVIMTVGDVERGLQTLYGAEVPLSSSDSDFQLSQSGREADADTLRDKAREEPVVRQLDTIFFDALEARASDIHIEPKPQAVIVRVRVDGALRPLISLNSDQGPPVISRLKILADLDVANSRSPQDGRASIIVRGRRIDIRVSTVPAAYGESVAVRILDRSAIELDFAKLGLTGRTGEMLSGLIMRPHGLTIMTGPTGSGKTTTLYAALDRVRSSKLKILTVEDPVEFRFEDVNQVQVNEAAGVTFASTLRAFLRQDPDIILVGEIRDSETARIAVQAALTGHLVLATLHTNDAASAAARLIDMGVEPFLLASVFNGAAAQRLVRRLCPKCSTLEPATQAQTDLLDRLGHSVDLTQDRFGKAHGCKACDNSGYSGRVAIVEAFKANDAIKGLIHQGASLHEVRQGLMESGMERLLDDGLEKARQGLTSLNDVLSVVAGGETDSATNTMILR